MTEKQNPSIGELGRKLLDILVVAFAIAGWIPFLRWIWETVEWRFMNPIKWFFAPFILEKGDAIFMEGAWLYLIISVLAAFTLYLIGRFLYSAYKLIVTALRYWKTSR